MGIEGFVVLSAAVLLLGYVLPTSMRHRAVLAYAPIEDRFAEDLRMLEVSKVQPTVHAGGQHGSVFFRRPEVEMAGSERFTKDVRELTRERARVRARMAKRSENLQRGFVGAFGGLIVTIVLWLVAVFTALPIVVAAVATLMLGIYGAGLAYLMRAAARANLADRDILQEIDAELGPRKAMGRRRASAIMRENSRKLASARTKAKLAADLEAARIAEAAERRRRRSEARGARRGAVERESGDVRGGAISGGREVVASADARGAKTGSAGAGVKGAGNATASRAAGRGEAGRSRFAPGASEAIRVDSRPRVIGRDREDAEVGSAKGLDARAEIAKARVAGRVGAAGAESEVRDHAGREATPSPRAELPSYTPKPRKIERRVVEPYAAPTGATAPVPYRPLKPGDRYDVVSGTVLPAEAYASLGDEGAGIPAWQEATASASGAAEGGAAAAGAGAGVVGGASEAGAGAAADGAGVRADAEADGGVITNGSDEVLGGGSVLDALLDRRRA